MDTLPDFLTPGYRMVFPNTNFFNICKTLPADTGGGYVYGLFLSLRLPDSYFHKSNGKLMGNGG